MKTKKDHIHKLKRVIYKSGNRVFFCALPDCTFKINPALALGKRSICWRCGKDFILTDYCLRLAKPHCENCHKPKNIDTSLEEITGVTPNDIQEVMYTPEKVGVLSLTERLNQTIQQAKQQEEEEL